MLTKFKIITSVFCLTLILCFQQTKAQVSVTPYIGLNWSTLFNSSSTGNVEYDEKFSLSIPGIGIEASRKIHKKGEIGLGIAYRPSTFNLLSDPFVPSLLTKVQYHLKYLDATAHYNLFIFNDLYLSGGIVLSYLLRDSRKETIAGNCVYIPDANIYPDRDFGLKFGIGYNLNRINARLKYYIGLAKLDRDGNTRMIQFDIGYRIIN
jgi:hypothetical protein